MSKVSMLFLALLLSACAAEAVETATPIPTPEIWHIAYASELGWLAAEFDGCLSPATNAGIVVEESQDIQVPGMEADMLLYWGEIDPQGMPAYRLGNDSIAVVLHPTNETDQLSVDELRQVYQGSITAWKDLRAGSSGSIHAWIYPAHLRIQQVFDEHIADAQQGKANLNIAPDVEAMLEAVKSDPDAIGFMPAYWLDGSIKTVNISDWEMPQVPVVLLLMTEPTEEQLDWLSCLTEGLQADAP
jgi:ABC-type phosphate transport system substrate-binding protein